MEKIIDDLFNEWRSEVFHLESLGDIIKTDTSQLTSNDINHLLVGFLQAYREQSQKIENTRIKICSHLSNVAIKK